MPYLLQIVTPPTAQPVTLAEAKVRCRITGGDDFSDLLNSFIVSETARAERVLGLRIMPQTLRLVFDGFPRRGSSPLSDGPTILLPGPVQSLTTFVYDDIDGIETTTDTDLYQLDTSGTYGRIGLTEGNEWPATAGSVWDNPIWALAAVRITYQAGYASADLVPQEIKSKILDAVCLRFMEESDQEKLDSMFEYCRY